LVFDRHTIIGSITHIRMKTFAILLPLFYVINVQSTTFSTTAPSKTITVGQNGHRFLPNSVSVAPGGKVVFQFWPNYHSERQGDYNNPCQVSNSSHSFNSGYVMTDNGPAVSYSSVQLW